MCNVLHVSCHVQPVTTANRTATKPLYLIIPQNNKKKHLEVYQYWRYTLRPEVSSPLGIVVSAMAQTDRHTHTQPQTLRVRD